MKAYKTEINPTKKQIQGFHQTFGNCRWIYNRYLANCINPETGKIFPRKERVSPYEFAKEFNNSEDRPEWILLSPSKAIKQAILDCGEAMNRYNKKISGHPRFKSKGKSKNSFYLIGSIKVERHRIKVPVFGWIRLKEFGYIPNNIKSVTISEKAGRYYISALSSETGQETGKIFNSNPQSDPIGIDFGIKDLFTTPDTSYGNINKEPKTKALEKKLRRTKRVMSRRFEANVKSRKYGKNGKLIKIEYKKPLSECRNYQKTKRMVARLEKRLSNIRHEYIRQVISSIVKQKPRFIVIEDLKIKNLMKNKHLAKHIGKANWYYARLFLIAQCKKHGVELRLVSNTYPSSKLCSNCKWKNTALQLNNREWDCPKCATHHHRDKNASKNLRDAEHYTLLVGA